MCFKMLIDFFRKILSFFGENGKNESNGNKGEIEEKSRKFVYSNILDATDRKLKIIPEDGKYYAPDLEKMKKIAFETKVDELEYIKNKFDCENFAGYLKSIVALKYGVNSIGKVIDYSSKHSFNIIILSDGQVKVFEPQNDNFIPVENDDRMYKLEKGYVII